MNSCSENLIVKLSVLVLFPVAVFFKHPGKNNFRESTHFCSQFKVHSIMSIVAGSVECVGEWQCLKQTGHMEFRVREQRRGCKLMLSSFDSLQFSTLTQAVGPRDPSPGSIFCYMVLHIFKNSSLYRHQAVLTSSYSLLVEVKKCLENSPPALFSLN